MRRSLVALFVGSLLLAGCQQTESKAEEPASRVEAAASFKDMSVEAARSAIDSDKSLVVVDVREPYEFTEGHIAQAKLNPLGDLESWSTGLDKNARILVVCRSGHRSSLAAAQLVEKGFTNVSSMTGGMIGWTGAGYPAVTGQ